jgi:hypothetical protein
MSSALALSVCSDVCFLHQATVHAILQCFVCCIGLVIIFADTKNAYQQSPPTTEPCYLEIDDAYHSWYCKQFGSNIDPGKYVAPVHRALQGHPEAGVLWEKMIVSILEGKELNSGLPPMNGTCTNALLMARLCLFAIKWVTLPLPPGPMMLLKS